MKKTPHVLLLVDWAPEQGSLLMESIQKSGIHCDLMGTDFKQARWTPVTKVFSHWPKCLWVALKAFRRRHDYDYVIAWPQVIGMFLGFIKLLTGSYSPRVFSLNTTLVERKNPLLEIPRRWFISLSYKKINHISFLSSASMRLVQERFGLTGEQCVPLKQPLTYNNNPDFAGFKPGSYLYSVGLSYRDYPTLMEAARKSPHKFIVATTDAFLKGLTIPDNVTVYRNTFGSAAEELMKEAAAAIFPLDRITSPAGETTLVSAMCYGKPVITTETITTREYITHGENGLLVPCKDPDAIVDAVNTLFSDPEKAAAIGRRARETALENHTMDVYAGKIVEVIVKDLNGAQGE